ncbi:probable amino-acid acetyltransferase NAGS1, chloroplastic isoform X1 [Tanacetum coccineum]
MCCTRCEPKYVERYLITDADSLKAAMDTTGRICLMIEAKLSPGPSICSVCRHGKNRRVHDGVSVASGNFLAAKKEELLKALIIEQQANTYEVSTACALALGAEKLICIIDGPILDEWGRLIQFLTLEDVDMLIRRRAQQSEVVANYVKAISEESNSFFKNIVSGENSQARSQMMDGYIVTDSDEEDDDDEEDRKWIFDSTVLAAF